MKSRGEGKPPTIPGFIRESKKLGYEPLKVAAVYNRYKDETYIVLKNGKKTKALRVAG